MSATAQTNGKRSSSSSIVNTPASTPVTNGNPQSIPQSTTPLPNNNAPKYGTLVPNRIFVGGISANTTEGELLQLFSTYGTVKAAKIIQDRAGVSKGYGFITFESEDDAKRPLSDADNIVLKERKLNIAPAIKKQPFNRTFDAASPPAVAPGNPTQFFFPPSPGVPYFQGGVAYYPQPPPNAAGDPNGQPTTVYQAPPVYPTQTGPPQAPSYPSMMFPLPHYVPQQYPMPLPYDYYNYASNGGPQYLVGGQNGPGGGGGGAGGGNNGAGNNGGCPPMPATSTSPPRAAVPPCYGQLHYNAAAAADTVFYNLPMYAAPIDAGAALYGDGLDGIPNGPYGEGPFSLVEPSLQDLIDHHHNHQQGHHPQRDAGADQRQQHHPHHPHSHPQLLPQFAMGLNAPITNSNQQQQPPNAAAMQQMDGGGNDSSGGDSGRQSRTPVVSMLSMEQHPDKDFVSMQAGRRKPPQQPPPPHQPPPQQPRHHQQIGYAPPPQFHVYANYAAPPPYHPHPRQHAPQLHHQNARSHIGNAYKSAPSILSNNNNNNTGNGPNNGWRKGGSKVVAPRCHPQQGQPARGEYHNNNNEEENRNEDKLCNGGSRGGYGPAAARSGRAGQAIVAPPPVKYQQTVSQVRQLHHGGAPSGPSQQQQHGVVASGGRSGSTNGRAKKARRPGQAGGGEMMGAGDAPPLGEVAVGDACKKLDGLKL